MKIRIRDYGDVELIDDKETVAALAKRMNVQAFGLVSGNDLYDLRETIPATLSEAEFVTPTHRRALDVLRHSTSHTMAQAIRRLWPDTRLAIGPAIETGFYYDLDSSHTFVTEDLPLIEKEMRKIAEEKLPITREFLPKAEALALFAKDGEIYKTELASGLNDGTITLYRQGEFYDLCRGPHLLSTSAVKHFKLLSIAGAYWRGDEKNKMLTRIYGTAFTTADDLKNYLTMLEEAAKRDHRKLGRELELFTIEDEVGAGLIIHLPKGAMLRRLIEDFEVAEHLKRGYELVKGPEILKTELWKNSGHYDHYRENMYFTEIDGVGYGIKPMNCLSHMLIFKSKTRSYRDLPKRYFELGTVHRHEKSGVLHGLMRVREFTQDDAHLIVRHDQLTEEIVGVIHFVDDVLRIFGFSYEAELSTRPENSIGTDEDWKMATDALVTALESMKLPYEINEGDGAFYGPKIDIKLKDAIGRKWQCATVQCDFTLPERFDLTYVDKDGQRKRPAMLHRVILGSLERFMGVLIEHYAGLFPLWLAPVQTTLLTITDEVIPFAEEVEKKLRSLGVRLETNFRNEKISHKVREAELAKIPYIAVIGKKEAAESTLSVRSKYDGSNTVLTIDDFITRLTEESKPPLNSAR